MIEISAPTRAIPVAIRQRIADEMRAMADLVEAGNVAALELSTSRTTSESAPEWSVRLVLG